MALQQETLDGLDTRIIKALQKDARRSFKSIAKDLDVSEGTISNRVSRLVKKNILKLEARVNPFKLSNKIGALVGITLSDCFQSDTMKEIEQLPQVNAVWATTGQYNIMFEILVNSIGDLNEFISAGGLERIQNISHIEAYLMLDSTTKYLKIA